MPFLVRQFKGTGATGGHGMSESINDELENKRKEEAKLLRGGLVVGCPKCGETFKLFNKHTFQDADMFEEFLRHDCPYCWGKEYCYQANTDKFLWSMKKRIKHKFEVEGKDIDCIRIP